MMVYNSSNLQQLLRSLGVGPHRLRGQNFLIDEAVVDRILQVAAVSSGDTVLEIGPGLGALSQKLETMVGRLILIELEVAFANRLRDVFSFSPKVEVIDGDAVLLDYPDLCRQREIFRYDLVANLPYSITTPFLRRLFLYGGPWNRATLMLQKEAATRICSGTGRENGPLSLLTQYCAEAQYVFDVPQQCFYPQPAVCSGVIQLTRRVQPIAAVDMKRLFSLIDAAFSQRRKQLVNTLTAYCPADGGRLDRIKVESALHACGLQKTVRAEQLGLSDFVALLKELG